MARAKNTKSKSPSIPAAKRRKGFLAVAIPWLRRFGITCGLVLFIIWLGAWGVATGAFVRAAQWSENQFLTASANAGFKIENLLVEGRVNTEPNLLMALLNIQTGDPLFSVNPNDAQQLLENIKWIKHAYIQRRLPDTIYIKLTERTPSALLETDHGKVLLDENSTAIEIDNISPFDHLITLSGAGSQDAMTFLITSLNAVPDIKTRITKAHRLGKRRWDLTLDNGITLRMPEDDNLASPSNAPKMLINKIKSLPSSTSNPSIFALMTN